MREHLIELSSTLEKKEIYPKNKQAVVYYTYLERGKMSFYD